MSNKDEYKRESEQMQALLGEFGELLEDQSGFVQRRSKLDGKRLVQILTLGALENGQATLENFCQVARDLGLEISPSGLHQRLNREAVELLRQVCQFWIDQKTRVRQGCGVLMDFAAVRIFDSSRISLASELGGLFPGSRNGATLKVQLVYEYHTGRIEALEVETGRSPDQSCRLPQDLSEAGDLALFDLGYFDQKRFAELDEKGVYFLSRLQSQVGLYEKDQPDVKLDLLAQLNALGDPIHAGECHLLMGHQKKVPVRVFYYRLPADVVQERRRKARKEAKQRGKTCSQHALDWLDWVIFISNAPENLLNSEQVAIVYRLRWQIEIIFKVWKQEMDWAVMGNWRVERILCQFYARCLALLLFHRLIEKYQGALDPEISCQKAIRCLKRKIQSLIEIVSRQFRGLLGFLKQLDGDIRRFARKTKRRTSLSTYDLLKNVRA
jgi:hypothetical protein